MSLNPLLGRLGENHEPGPNVRLYNSCLGEVDPLGRDLQVFESVPALKSPNFAQIAQPTIPKRHFPHYQA
ncbi:hypothetical protein DEO72_LG3g1784 [Vigna unguiculata]|uniref:Uncharacterized protein n=1 Tax=Vigna unguiculata TaxID=3917 RepID=A0A4D6LFH1_VIGUN|nr:hypothetical protein DEO72_LG3g1784 [Vigna unguiculata]